MSAVELVVSQTPVETAAQLLVQWLRASGARRLGVPGGSALQVLLRAVPMLTDEERRSVRLTFVDERVVPHESPESNFGAALRAGLVPAQFGAVVPLALDGESAEAACVRSTDQLQRSFSGALDVALLGLGEDGHVASLFPNHPALRAGGLVTWLDDSPKPPAVRVTLTVPVLAAPNTRRLVFAVGAGKRRAVEQLIARAPIPPSLLGPVTLVGDAPALQG